MPADTRTGGLPTSGDDLSQGRDNRTENTKAMQQPHEIIRVNSLRAWLLATRPKTLSAAAVPVIIGIALAVRTVGWVCLPLLPAVLCLLFAWLMQIDSNLINDYFDYVRGNDDRDTRLGPKRACAEGWVTLPAMRLSIAVTSVAACLAGLPLIAYGGLEMVAVGAVCVVCAFLYTTFFASKGLGDVLVVVFFGMVPVYFTWYVLMPIYWQDFNMYVLVAGFCCGLVIDTLLLVNNYRDRDNDKASGKITLVVRVGAETAERLYWFLPLMAGLMLFGFLVLDGDTPWWKAVGFILLSLVYYVPHQMATRKMADIGKGRELNKVLGMTARNIFVYGLVTAAQILLFCHIV